MEDRVEKPVIWLQPADIDYALCAERLAPRLSRNMALSRALPAVNVPFLSLLRESSLHCLVRLS